MSKVRFTGLILTLGVLLPGSICEAWDKSPAPRCPTLPKKDANGQAVTARQPTAAEVQTLRAAATALGQLVIPNATAMRDCVNKRLDSCTLCVAAQAAIGSRALTFGQNSLPGWGGEGIVISAEVVAAGSTPSQGGGYTAGFCMLLGTLVHELTHANSTLPKASNMDLAKKHEEEAVEAQKKVLVACGMATTDPYYKFLCRWVKVLCDRAEKTPTARPNYKCAAGNAKRAWSGGGGVVYPHILYAATEIDPHTIYACTWATDGSHREEYTAIHTIRDLVLYHDAPVVGHDTLLVLGSNSGGQVTQYQTMEFDGDGWLVSSSNKSTLSQCVIPLAAHADGSDVTYLYDADQQEILRFLDTDADGVPDSWGTPYADATMWPAVGQTLALTVSGNGDVLASSWGFQGGSLSLDEEMNHFVDTNADGVADAMSSYLLKDETQLGPDFAEAPKAGDIAVVVFATVNTVIELWDATANGDLLAQRGVAAVDYGLNMATIQLSTPLTAGEFLVAKEAGANHATAPHEVSAP